MQLQLTDDEGRLLAKMVERYRGELSMEIADTDNSRFHDELREEQGVLNALIQKLQGAGVGGA